MTLTKFFSFLLFFLAFAYSFGYGMDKNLTREFEPLSQKSKGRSLSWGDLPSKSGVPLPQHPSSQELPPAVLQNFVSRPPSRSETPLSDTSSSSHKTEAKDSLLERPLYHGIPLDDAVIHSLLSSSPVSLEESLAFQYYSEVPSECYPLLTFCFKNLRRLLLITPYEKTSNGRIVIEEQRNLSHDLLLLKALTSVYFTRGQAAMINAEEWSQFLDKDRTLSHVYALAVYQRLTWKLSSESLYGAAIHYVLGSVYKEMILKHRIPFSSKFSFQYYFLMFQLRAQSEKTTVHEKVKTCASSSHEKMPMPSQDELTPAQEPSISLPPDHYKLALWQPSLTSTPRFNNCFDNYGALQLIGRCLPHHIQQFERHQKKCHEILNTLNSPDPIRRIVDGLLNFERADLTSPPHAQTYQYLYAIVAIQSLTFIMDNTPQKEANMAQLSFIFVLMRNFFQPLQTPNPRDILWNMIVHHQRWNYEGVSIHTLFDRCLNSQRSLT